MKISRHYDIRELVPPETYDKWGDNSRWFIRESLVDVLELLHAKIQLEYRLDSKDVNVIINNYHYAKSGSHIYKYSGYRPPTAYINDEILKKNPNSESLHRQGCAADVKVMVRTNSKWHKLSTKRVHNIIKKYTFQFMNYGLTTLEREGNTPSWTHIDLRDTGKMNIHYI